MASIIKSLYISSCNILVLLLAFPLGDAKAQQVFEPPTWPTDTPRPISAPKADLIGEVLRTRPVVRAAVEEQEAHISGRIISLQRIKYVYSGPPELVGRTFKDISVAADFPGGRRGTFYLADPTLEVGETGIWMLVPWQDTWFREAYQSLGTWWPARPNVPPPLGPDYESVRLLAEAMETVWHAETEEERVELLKGFASSETPEVAIGAIKLLEEVVPDELNRFVSEANLLNLPLRAQIVIDEVMMKSRREEWRDADTHQRFLRAWQVRAMGDESDAQMILIHLGSMIQRREIEADTLLEFLRPIITGELRVIVRGEQHPLDVRILAVSLVRWIIDEPKVRDDAFQLMADLLESDESDRLKLVAARMLQSVTELKRGQIAHLKQLRDHYDALAMETDDERALVHRIAALLDETVNNLTPNEQVEGK